MGNFGQTKSKILKKITESFSNENKNEVKNILQQIKENRSFKEMYLLYEDIENKYIDDVEVAKIYVEELSTMLKNTKVDTKKINSLLENVEPDSNDVYGLLDVLSENDSLLNIEKKVHAKKKLIEHLTTKKETVNESVPYTQNENLLHAVMANNFNMIYGEKLNEEEKSLLKNILSMSKDETEEKTKELKESIKLKIEEIINESNDNDFLVSKLKDVKSEVEAMDVSKYNYYRLIELKNGL